MCIYIYIYIYIYWMLWFDHVTQNSRCKRESVPSSLKAWIEAPAASSGDAPAT